MLSTTMNNEIKVSYISGGSRGGAGGARPPFQKNNKTLGRIFVQFCSKKWVLLIFIYNIALQNTDLGVLQKSSKHFLIYVFFQPLSFRTPPPPSKKYKK